MYIATRCAIFKGFNGTDDLHYAMLAANMLKGSYNPFAAGDIFSGRVLLVAWQALFYRLGGVTVFTTQAPAWLAVVLSCWLTVFKMAKAGGAKPIITVAALFYFNPVLTYATDGILPDVYVMLAGIITLLLWNNSLLVNNTQRQIRTGMYIALVVAASLFFKETALVLPVLIMGLALLQRGRPAAITCAAMLAALFVLGVCGGWLYYYFTGDVFYRLRQVSNSSYYNPCSYTLLPASFIVTRLTYGVWKLFLQSGFYPVLLATGLIFHGMVRGNGKMLWQNNAVKSFVILLAIGLYLPFSLSGYQPLCSDSARHFLFLLPVAMCACAPYLLHAFAFGKTTNWLLLCVALLLLCVAATPDKWQWLVWALLAAYFAVQKLVPPKFAARYKYVVFATILLLCMPYRLFYNNSNWFANMRQLNKQLGGNYYYFADHDNLMHWRLLHGFSNSIRCYNTGPAPYKVFALYYEQLDSATFKPGWLLINKKYTERSINFLHVVDSLQSHHYFNKQVAIGDLEAVYLGTPDQLKYVEGLAGGDEKLVQ